MNFENRIVCRYLLNKKNSEIYLGIERLNDGQEYKECIYLGEFLERWTSKIELEDANDLIALIYSVLSIGSTGSSDNEQIKKFVDLTLEYINSNNFTEEELTLIYFGLHSLYSKYNLEKNKDILSVLDSKLLFFADINLLDQLLMVFISSAYSKELLEKLIPILKIDNSVFNANTLEELTLIKILGMVYKIGYNEKVKLSSDLKKILIGCRDISTKEEKNLDKYPIERDKVIKLNYTFLSNDILGTMNLGLPATTRIVTRYINSMKQVGKLEEVLNEKYIQEFFISSFRSTNKKYLSEYQIDFTDLNDLVSFITKVKYYDYSMSQVQNYFNELLNDYKYFKLLENPNFENVHFTTNYLSILNIILKVAITKNRGKKVFDDVFNILEFLYKNNLSKYEPIDRLLSYNSHSVLYVINDNNLLDENLCVYGYKLGSYYVSEYLRIYFGQNMEQCLEIMNNHLDNKQLASVLYDKYNLSGSYFLYDKVAKLQSKNKNFYEVYFRFFKSQGIIHQYMYILINYLNDIYEVYDFTQEEKDALEIEINTYYQNKTKYDYFYTNYLIKNFDRVCSLMNYSKEEQLNIKETLMRIVDNKKLIANLFTKEDEEFLKFKLLKENLLTMKYYSDSQYVTAFINKLENYKSNYPNNKKEIEELVEMLYQFINKSDKNYNSMISLDTYFKFKKDNIYSKIVADIEKYYA